MGTPTNIEVSMNATEYCRYESGRNQITATVTVSGGFPYSSEEVLVELVKARGPRNVVVYSTSVFFTGVEDFLNTDVVFDLTTMFDVNAHPMVRRGNYLVRATSVSNGAVIGESPDFKVSILTADKFRADYLFGLSLTASQKKSIRFPVTNITGVTVSEVSYGTPNGMYVLSYVANTEPLQEATVTIGNQIPDGQVVIATVDKGSGGNGYSVEIVDPGVPSSPLTITLVGALLTISLATNLAGNIGTTANQAVDIANLLNLTYPDDFSAVVTGTGLDSVTVPASPVSFAGGSNQNVRSLSWEGGTAISIGSSGTYVLPFGGGNSSGSCGSLGANKEYMIVTISSLSSLPSTSVIDTLLVENSVITDDTLRSYIEEAINWLEEVFLHAYIEPTIVTTDPDPLVRQSSVAPFPATSTALPLSSDYDKIVSPVSYTVGNQGTMWIKIKLPFMQMLKVNKIFGVIGNTQVISIPNEWISHSFQGGLIQLVPFNYAFSAYLLGLMSFNAIRGATEIPNFWHFEVVAGLLEIPPLLIEAVARKAAMLALTVAGNAIRPGIGSTSLSRDGVSESVSYINSAKYGPYTGAIQSHSDWFETNKDLLRAKYRGSMLTVV